MGSQAELQVDYPECAAARRGGVLCVATCGDARAPLHATDVPVLQIATALGSSAKVWEVCRTWRRVEGDPLLQ